MTFDIKANLEDASGSEEWQAHMHRNLLNAGFAFVDYSDDGNENVHAG